MSSEPIVHTCFEPVTCTWQYVVADPGTKAAVIIDPVLDFDPAKNAISTTTADALLSLARENGYTITRLIETHAHADHLTAAHYLQRQLEVSGAPKPAICIGKRIDGVQDRFAKRYGIEQADYARAFDHLVDDDEVFSIGNLSAKALHLPGHTPDHMGYVIGCTSPFLFHLVQS
jgi:glyoxylase-like metal-dependent hydrolase (beta-lactamase superfamily II)